MPFTSSNLPGIIVSEERVIEEGVYSNQGQAQTFTLDLTGVTVTQGGNYALMINGSLITFIYTGTGGLNDLVSQLANYLNEFGFFWATVINPTTIRLVARVVGTNYVIEKSLGLNPSVLTQTLPGLSPVPLVPGTLLFYDIRLDNAARTINDHRSVTTYDQVSGVAGFNILRHCAGILIAEESNDGVNSAITRSAIRLLRQGEITYRNYGTNNMSRLVPVTISNTVPTQLLPGGSMGGNLPQVLGSLTDRLLPDSFTIPGQIGRMRISL